MKKLLSISLIFAAVLLFSACNKIEPDPSQKVIGTGYYVLNCGNWGSNDANIGIINLQTVSVEADAFKTANGKALGDLAEDAIEYGSRLYIAVYGSSTVFVTDKMTLKIEKAIADKSPLGGNLSPRHFTANGQSVYVTYYEGYVGEIDTMTLAVKNLVKVGDNPEDIVYCNGKLYVANSGGMNYPNFGNTVSVIDAATMKLERDIEVGLNPNHLAVDSNKNVYVLSWGDYAATPGQLQAINTTDYSVSTVSGVSNPQDMAMGVKGQLYVLTSSYDSDWNTTTDIVIYNTLDKRYMGSLSSSATEIKNKYSISTDYSLGEYAQGVIFIGTSDYVSTGDIYLFDYNGNKLCKMDTGGMNPVKAIPVAFTYIIQ